MATIDTNLQSAILKQIAYSDERNKILSRNIANADTPGYQRSDLKDLEFKDLINHNAKNMPDMILTSSKHLSSLSQPQLFKGQIERNTLLSKEDTGVNIEQEMTEVSLNYGKAQFARNLYKKYLALWRTALGKDGGVA